MIKSISITHYKCFYEAQHFELAIPDGHTASGLTTIVGANNSGKTSILELIRILSQENPHVDSEFRHDGHELFVEITDTNNDKIEATNPDLGSSIVFFGNKKVLNSNNFRYISSRRSWTGYTNHQAMDRKFYWINTSQQNKNVADEFFVARIAKMTAEEREIIRADLKIVMPQIDRWTIDRSRGQLYVKYILKDGSSHSSDLFGDGLASVFRIIVSINDCKQGGEDGPQILFIDEPELSLHPQAQKSLSSYIAKAASDLQIVITTHSPYFVRWADIARGSKIYRVSKLANGSKISTISPDIMKKIKSLYDDWQKPNLLDPVARELFFSDRIVYFEGQEDVGLLRRFCEANDLTALEFFGYGVGGSGNIKYFLQLAKDLNIKAYAMYDGDKKSDMEHAKKAFPEFFIDILPADDIRDKMKKDEKGKDTTTLAKEGLFDKNGAIKGEHKQYLISKITEITRFLDT